MNRRDPKFWKEFGLAQKERHQKENKFVEAVIEGDKPSVAAEKAGYKGKSAKGLLGRHSVGKKLLRKLQKTRVTAQVMHELSQRVVANAMLPGAMANADNETKRTAIAAAKLAKDQLKDFDGKTPEERALEQDEGTDRVAMAKAFLEKNDGSES